MRAGPYKQTAATQCHRAAHFLADCLASQAETESTARDASRQGGLMRMFAFVAVFISTLMLGFALNPDNRVELNRGLEMLRTVGGWSYAPG
jgi:hypothetical protein